MSGSTSILDSLAPIQPPAGMLANGAGGQAQPDASIPTVTVRAPKPNAGTSVLDSLPAVPPTAGMLAAQGKQSGNVLPQVGYGAQEGVMGLANIPTQIPRAIGELGTMAYNAITGRNAQNPTPTYQAGPFPEPQGTRESMARAIGQGLPAIPLMGAGEAAAAPSFARAGAAALRSAVTTTLPVVAGQVGGEVAREVAPEPYKEPAQIGGAVLGGGAVALGQGLAGASVRAGIARPAAGAGIGRQQTFQGAGGEPIRATATQADIAASKLREAADQSGPNGAERFQTMLETSPGEIVPGSAPMTAQVAPLPGIAKLEDTVKSSPGGGPAFNARAEQQNAARVGAVQALHPQSNPAAVGQFFRDQLTALDGAGQNQIAGARGGVQASTEALGGRGAPAAYGQEMRGAIQGALDPVQAERRNLWTAVDPDGTLALDAAPIQRAAKTIQGQLTPSDTLTAGEQGVLSHAASMTGVVPFSDLQTLRSNILDAQRRSAAGEPLTTRGMNRLNTLKGAVDESFAAAVEQKAAHEAQAVASGVMTPEQTMMGRLQAQEANAGQGSAGDRGAVSGGYQGPAEAPSVSPGAGNANAQAGRQPGVGGGNRPISAQSAAQGRRPESLIDFLIARGGVQDQGGDLRAIGADTIHHQQGGRLVNPRGAPLDYAREAAEEAGFLRPNSTVNDLLDAIAEHASGRPVYRISDQAEGDLLARDRREAGRQSEAYDRARAAVETAEADAGARLSDEEMDHAAKMVMQGAHPQQALMDVVRPREDAGLQRNSQMMAFGRPGMAPGAEQSAMPVGGRNLTPNFDEAAAARYAAAREATLREKERFGRGAVGEVLARGKAGAPNNVLDADVPAKFFTGRPSEPAQVKAYFKAVGGEPKGVALARDYLVSDLRRNSIISPDGTLNAEAFARWQQRRGETIKLFPGLSDEFATAESAQRALDNVQEAHAAALKEFQNGVAKHFLNEEPGRAVQKMLNSADRAKLMQQAIGKLQGNADALESLKGHVIDYVLDRLTTSAKATEQNAAAPNLSEIGSLRADAFKDWITDNKPWLRRLFGGQGMQNLEMVGADLRRQQTRGIASSGSATTERAAAVQKHGGFKDHLPTILGIIGMKMGSMAAEAVGLHGVGELMSEAIGASVPVAAHAFRQRGITTINDLVREAMLHPSVARELMARPKGMSIGNIAQRRLAHAMQAVAVAQSGTQETRE